MEVDADVGRPGCLSCSDEGSQPETHQMQMESLPPELLLEILAYLPLSTLLQVRAVCRRWRELAVRKELWAHRQLKSYNQDARSPKVMAPLLAAAPCLDRLFMHPKIWDSPAARATSCAVRELCLDNMSLGTPQSARALEVVRVQAALGRLRKLEITLGPGFLPLDARPAPTAGVDELLEAVKAARVTDVELRNTLYSALPPPSGNPSSDTSSPYLRSLAFRSQAPAVPLLHSLLQAHAGTLEHVGLNAPVCSGRAFLLLRAAGPQLRSLELPLTEDLILFRPQDFPALTSLKLACMPERRSSDQFDITPMFRDATQLRELCFYHCYDDYCGGDHDDFEDELESLNKAVEESVEALASSGRSMLNKLIYRRDSNVEKYPISLRCFGFFFSGLRHLHTLELEHIDIEVDEDKFLDGISEKTAPGLRLLQITTDDPTCPAARCAVPYLRSLLDRAPKLHVVYTSGLYCNEDEHPSVRNHLGGMERADAFFAHDAADQCELHQPGMAWYRLRTELPTPERTHEHRDGRLGSPDDVGSC